MNAIYCLRDSEGVVRYVGNTTKPLAVRLKRHLAEARRKDRKCHRTYWLRGLVQPPTIEIIEWVPPLDWQERERYWIALFRDYGHRLVNGTDGGDGVIGATAEARARMGAPHRGKPGNPVAIAAMTAANTGRVRTPEHLQRNADANRGKKRTPEAREKMRQAKLGKSLSPTHRENMSKAHAGKIPSVKTMEAAWAATTGKKQAPWAIAKRIAIRKKNKEARERGEI